MDFFDILVRYEIALWNAVDQELLRAQQLSLGQLHALRVVERHAGRARVQELSADIGITVGAASKLVDRLDRDGLTRRQPHPSDRRSSLITLTSTGRRAVESGTALCRSAIARAVGDEDVAPVTAALHRLQGQLSVSGVGAVA